LVLEITSRSHLSEHHVRRRPRTSRRKRLRSVKLLLDENLSFRLVARLAPAFSDSAHVDSVGLHAQVDSSHRLIQGDGEWAH
jgi:hypothetical protein